MTAFGKIKFYADKACTTLLSAIKWDQGFEIVLQSGKKEILDNTAAAGSIATATVYVRNEEKYKFAVTKISHTDIRVDVRISSDWLLPNNPVKVTISYKVPEVTTPKDVVMEGMIIIDGYYVLGDK